MMIFLSRNEDFKPPIQYTEPEFALQKDSQVTHALSNLKSTVRLYGSYISISRKEMGKKSGGWKEGKQEKKKKLKNLVKIENT